MAASIGLLFTYAGEFPVVASDKVDDLFLGDVCRVLGLHFYAVALRQSADVAGVGVAFEAFDEFVESVSGYSFDFVQDFLGGDVSG